MQQTYYQFSAEQDLTFPKLERDLDVQVCVIGAGFAGLATALGLLERGVKSVAVVEAKTVGFGASGRNGGFVFGGFSLDSHDLLKQLGPSKAKALYQLTLDAVQLIRRRVDQHRIDCDKNESGVLLANWFDDQRSLSTLQNFMRNSFDVDWTYIDKDQLRQELVSERYFGALHEKNAFHFHPLKYAQGIARVIQEQGGEIFENTSVTMIESVNASKLVRTNTGRHVKAQHVVVCCGGYINGLVPRLSRAVLPIATYVMATEPLGDRLQSAMRTGAAVYDTRFAFDYYRPLADSRLLWGGRISIAERTPQQVQNLLYHDLLKVYPQLRGTKVDFAWSGLMSYGRHKMPQLGRLENGLWYGLGFGGHGVAPTTLAGEVLAQAIAFNSPLPAGFESYGLPSTLGPLGLLGAQMTYWYYELRDYLRQ
ncbi:MAG: FAD-binding oxidoreductase [Burkholderiaceae bacterium]|nr:MAG: FAD-binding oxidoreductase [Burkholderiaceae bacterium]